MSNKKLTKQQLLKAIEGLEQNPDNKLGFLTDIGIGAVGAGIAGGAVAAFGGTSIMFGLVTLAAPVGLVVGGAALGGAALIGLKKAFFDNPLAYTQGQQEEILRQLNEQLKEVEAKERSSKLKESDKTKFIVSLKEPVKLELISPEDAQQLIAAVENGQMPIKDAIKMIEDVVKSTQTR